MTIHRELFTEIVIETRRAMRPPVRIIAIGRRAIGQPFVVTAPPADFAEAVAEVDSRHAQEVRLSDEALAEIESEKIGEEICQAPWQW